MTEKTVYTIVRIIIGGILMVVLLNMFILEPKSSDSGVLNQDNLWEAVHPFKIWDGVAMIFLVGFSLYLAGLLGKFYNLIQPGENSSGAAHVIAAISFLGMGLFFL